MGIYIQYLRWPMRRGGSEFKADLVKAFESCSIDQRAVNPEIAMRADWAFEIATVGSTLTPLAAIKQRVW